MEFTTVTGILIAIGAFSIMILMRKWLLNKAYERRRNTWFPPDELADKSIEEYTKQKKTLELNQLKSIQHIERLW